MIDLIDLIDLIIHFTLPQVYICGENAPSGVTCVQP